MAGLVHEVSGDPPRVHQVERNKPPHRRDIEAFDKVERDNPSQEGLRLLARQRSGDIHHAKRIGDQFCGAAGHGLLGGEPPHLREPKL